MNQNNKGEIVKTSCLYLGQAWFFLSEFSDFLPRRDTITNRISDFISFSISRLHDMNDAFIDLDVVQDAPISSQYLNLT